MPLYLAQFDDRLHEGGELEDQRGQGGSVVLAGERGAGQQPGRLAQACARRGGAGCPAVGDPGGPGVGVRRSAQLPVPECAGGGVQGIGCGPGGVAGSTRIRGGAATDLIPGVFRGTRRVFPDRVPFRRSERIGPAGPGGCSVPACAQLGQAQVGGELPATEPDRSPGTCRVGRERDGVAGDLARTTAAGADPHQDTGVPEPGEELLLAGRSGRRGADGTAERDPGRFGSAVAAGLLLLRAGGAASRSPVRWRGAAETKTFLGRLAGLPHPIEVVPVARSCSVLAGQHGHDVDVIRGVPDRDPPDRLVVLPVRRQPGAVHDVPGQTVPTPRRTASGPPARPGPRNARPAGRTPAGRTPRAAG